MSRGFTVFNVNHKRDLGVIELGFRNSSRRPVINLQGDIVGEGGRLSTMTIGTARDKFSPNGLLAPRGTYFSPKWFSQLLSSNYPGKLHYYQDSQIRDYGHFDRIFSKELKMAYLHFRNYQDSQFNNNSESHTIFSKLVKIIY